MSNTNAHLAALFNERADTIEALIDDSSAGCGTRHGMLNQSEINILRWAVAMVRLKAVEFETVAAVLDGAVRWQPKELGE